MNKTISQQLVEKTMAELAAPDKPKARSRMWQSSNGYIYLIPWSNANLLRLLIRVHTKELPRSEYRLKAQINDAARSTIANIEEGFARPTTAEYLTFLGYSQASHTEVKGDIQRSRQDGFLRSVLRSSLAGVGINLKGWHEALKESVISKPVSKGDYRKLKEIKGSDTSSKVLQNPIKSSIENRRKPNSSTGIDYLPFNRLEHDNLTYEIFIELINKTDWHLRQLVQSLEKKLNTEHKGYQIEKARVRSNIAWKR